MRAIEEDVEIEVGDIVVSIVAARAISPLALFVSHTRAASSGGEAALGDTDTIGGITTRLLLSIDKRRVPFTFRVTSLTDRGSLVARTEGINTSSRSNIGVPLAHGVDGTRCNVVITNTPLFNTSVGGARLLDMAESAERTTALFTSRRFKRVDRLALIFTALGSGSTSIPDALVVGLASSLRLDVTVLFTAAFRTHDGVPDTVVRIIVAASLSIMLNTVLDTAEGLILRLIPSTLFVTEALGLVPFTRADNLTASRQSRVPDTAVLVVTRGRSTVVLAIRFLTCVALVEARSILVTRSFVRVSRTGTSTSSSSNNNVGPTTLRLVTHIVEASSESETTGGLLNGVPTVARKLRETIAALIEVDIISSPARVNNRSTRNENLGVSADSRNVVADVATIVEVVSTSTEEDNTFTITVSEVTLVEHLVSHDETEAAVNTIIVVTIANTSVDCFVPVDFLLELIDITSERITRVVRPRREVVDSRTLTIVGNVTRTTPHEGSKTETRILLGNTTREVPLGLSQREARQPTANSFHITNTALAISSSSNLEGEEDIHRGTESHIQLDTSTNLLGVGVNVRTIPEAAGILSTGARSSPARATTFVATIDTITAFPEALAVFVTRRQGSVSVEAEANITGTRALRIKIPTTLSIITALGNSLETIALVVNALVGEGRPRTLRVGITPRAVSVEGATRAKSGTTTISEARSRSPATIFTSVTISRSPRSTSDPAIVVRLQVTIITIRDGITRVPTAEVTTVFPTASVVVVTPVIVAPAPSPIPVVVTVVPPPPPAPPPPPTSPPVPPVVPVIPTTVPVESPVVRPVPSPVPVSIVTPVPVPAIVTTVPIRKIPEVEVVRNVVTTAVRIVENETSTTIVTTIRTSDPTPVVVVAVVGTTKPTTLTTRETVNEVVFTIASDSSEVTTLREVVTLHTVIVSLPEGKSTAALGGDPFIVVTPVVLNVSTKIPGNNTVVVTVRSCLEVDGVEDLGVLDTIGTTSDGENTIVTGPRLLDLGATIVLEVELIVVTLIVGGDTELSTINIAGEVDVDGAEDLRPSVVAEVTSRISLIVSIRETLFLIVSECCNEDESQDNNRAPKRGRRAHFFLLKKK